LGVVQEAAEPEELELELAVSTVAAELSSL
jgi:hypothetical protein